MRYRFKGIKTNIDVPMSDLPAVTAAKLRIPVSDIKDFEVRRKSVDSRKKPYIQYVYTVDFDTEKKLRIPKKLSKDISSVDNGSERPLPPSPGDKPLASRPVVVGMGPAGLFAALELAKAGYILQIRMRIFINWF